MFDRTWIGVIGAVLLLALSVVVYGLVEANAQNSSAARVEVTVWQRVSDGSLYLSTRPEGGRWTTHSEPLDMSALSASGNFRQGSAITVDVIPVNRVSISGVGPGSHPFVLPKGLWRCQMSGYGAFASLDGQFLGSYGPPIVLVGPGEDSEYVTQFDTSTSSIEIDAASPIEWTFTCEKTP